MNGNKLVKAVLNVYDEGASFDTMRARLDGGGFSVRDDIDSIGTIREMIKARNPVIIELNDGRVLPVVGEHSEALIVKAGEELYDLTDDKAVKNWSGRSVAIVGVDLPISKAHEGESVDHGMSVAVFASERDDWSDELYERKLTAKSRIQSVSGAPEYMLPSHPAIVVFKMPSRQEARDGIRAKTDGIEIQILDPLDPFFEFLHDYGHIYWSTRLNDTEKVRFEELAKKCREMDSKPGIFVTAHGVKDGEEVFATVYSWRMRGEIQNEGYNRILREKFREGAELIESVFSRLARESELEKAWSRSEQRLNLYLNGIMKIPSSVMLGNALIKAHLPLEFPGLLEVPDKVSRETIREFRGREWVEIQSGRLRGRIVVLKAGSGQLDMDYMRRYGPKLDWIPVIVPASRRGKPYRRVKLVKAADYRAGLETPEQGPEEKREEQFMGMDMSTVMKKAWWKRLFGDR